MPNLHLIPQPKLNWQNRKKTSEQVCLSSKVAEIHAFEGRILRCGFNTHHAQKCYVDIQNIIFLPILTDTQKIVYWKKFVNTRNFFCWSTLKRGLVSNPPGFCLEIRHLHSDRVNQIFTNPNNPQTCIGDLSTKKYGIYHNCQSKKLKNLEFPGIRTQNVDFLPNLPIENLQP